MNASANCTVNEATIEKKIQELGLTAPRLCPDDLTDNIVDTEIVKHVSKSGQVLRWAVITVKNGFAVTGRPSVSVSKENDSAVIGEQVAITNARNELWPLMGYALREKLAEGRVIRETTFIKRMTTEYAELREKLDKLCSFLGSEAYMRLPEEEQEDLQFQKAHMTHYAAALERRIERQQT